MLLLCVGWEGTSVYLKWMSLSAGNTNSYKVFSRHNCHLWLMGGLWVSAKTVDKLEACFHGLHLLQQIRSAWFFGWRLGGMFRRGGWKREVEFGWGSDLLTRGHPRGDYFSIGWHDWGDYCPGARKAFSVLISAYPHGGWRSGDCIGRAGPDKRGVNEFIKA